MEFLSPLTALPSTSMRRFCAFRFRSNTTSFREVLAQNYGTVVLDIMSAIQKCDGAAFTGIENR